MVDMREVTWGTRNLITSGRWMRLSPYYGVFEVQHSIISTCIKISTPPKGEKESITEIIIELTNKAVTAHSEQKRKLQLLETRI